MTNKGIGWFLLMITVHLGALSTSNAGVPRDHLQVIHHVLMDTLGDDKAEDIKPLSGGFSSPGMYKVTAGGKSYVIRFSHPDWKLEDRTREIYAMQTAGKLGLAPKVFYADAQQGVIMMEFLAKDTPPAWQNMTDAYLRQLAGRMRTLHEGPALMPYRSLFEDIRLVAESITVDPLNLISSSLALNIDLEKDLKSTWQNKPCHNDLHPDNTIENGGQIYFIDWEEAGPSDPFRDLATYAMFCAMQPDRERQFLTHYLNRSPSDAEWKKYNQIKRAVLIYYGFVMVMLSQKQDIPMPTDEEIKALPAFREVNPAHYFENGYTQTILRFAFICLREANSLN